MFNLLELVYIDPAKKSEFKKKKKKSFINFRISGTKI